MKGTGIRTQQEDDQHQHGQGFAPGIELGDLVERLGVGTAQQEDEESPQPPAAPEETQQDSEDQDDRHDPVDTLAKDCIDDMTAIELAGRDEVQEGDQQAHPAGPGDLVDEDIRRSNRGGTADEEVTDPMVQQGQAGQVPGSGQEFPKDDEFRQQVEQGIAFGKAARERR